MKYVKRVIIDSDFIQKILSTDSKNNERAKQSFLNIMKDLDIQPVIHKLLLDKELMGNILISDMVNDNKIGVITLGDITSNYNEKRDYEQNFLMLYKEMNGKDFTDEDIFSYWKSDLNLGEIHSAIAASLTGMDLMLSDDKAAKKVISTRLVTRRHPLTIKNILEVIEDIGNKETDDTITTWKVAKSIVKALYPNHCERMYSIWHQ